MLGVSADGGGAAALGHPVHLKNGGKWRELCVRLTGYTRLHARTSLMLMPMLAKYSSVSFEMGAAPVKKNLQCSRPMACFA